MNTCRWDQKNTTSMTRDWLEDQYLFNFSAQKISKDRFLFHSQKLERKLDWTEFPTLRIASPSQDSGSWPDSCGTTMVWNTSLHLKRPPENYGIMHHWKPDPSFLLPLRQHLSLPMRTHLATTLCQSFLGGPERCTRTQLDVHVNRKRRKVACFFCQQKILGEPIWEKNNGQTEKSHSKFPATTDKCVSLRCPYTS